MPDTRIRHISARPNYDVHGPLGSPGNTVRVTVGDLAWDLDQRGTDQLIAQLIAARCETWPAPGSPAARFGTHADLYGVVRIVQIRNEVTKEWVRLPEPADVHEDDLDRFFTEHQVRFVAEWNAEHPDRAIPEESDA